MPSEMMREQWKSYAFYNSKPQSIRKCVWESWQRSKQYGVDPTLRSNPYLIDEEKLSKLKSKNTELITATEPILKNIFKFIQGSGFAIALADAEGTLLEVFGDTEATELTNRINFIPGSNWSERYVGTNAIGLVLAEKMPVQLYWHEHWVSCTRTGTCSAAPIFDPDSFKLIGVIDMTSGSPNKAHSHTLGMLVGGSQAIQNELSSARKINLLTTANAFQNSLIDSLGEGILAIDFEHQNLLTNKMFYNIFRFDESQVSYDNIDYIIQNLDSPRLMEIYKRHEDVSNELINTSRGEIDQKVLINSRKILKNGFPTGSRFIIAFEEFSRTERFISKSFNISPVMTFEKIVGQNKAFLQCLNLAWRASKTNSTVLLTGKSGTGKDILAQAIHNASPRKDMPFIVINCGAIPRDLLQSELFGYEEGAFTGAKKGGQLGKFELAQGGTMFLDEIGEMPFEMQTTLLRILENREFSRVGGNKTIKSDVRIIAATNKNLKEAVINKEFREDLYFRLNIIEINLPSLKERDDDIVLLFNHFLKKFLTRMNMKITNIQPDFIEELAKYSWPGNIRELQNLVERTLNLVTDGNITVDLLPKNIKSQMSSSDKYIPFNQNHETNLSELENKVILSCLKEFKGNKSLVAKKLGISRSTLYRRMSELDLHKG